MASQEYVVRNAKTGFISVEFFVEDGKESKMLERLKKDNSVTVSKGRRYIKGVYV